MASRPAARGSSRGNEARPASSAGDCLIALLRAVNVGGRSVGMDDLRDCCGALGFDDVRTLLQSGNVVFRARSGDAKAIERRVEAAAAKRFGFDIDVMVRTAAEMASVIAANPFPDHAKRDPARLVVVFLKSAPAKADVAALEAAIAGRETLRVAGPHAYIVYPDGQGRSRLTNTVIEKKLRTRGTARNWNTVTKLAALAGSR